MKRRSRTLGSRVRRAMLLAGAAVGLAGPAPAQSPPAVSPPRVALVLGGGGARGAAHVGVLKVLERLGVQPDLVVGTSMGAAIGGLYAAGMPVAEIERELLRTDWQAVFADQPARADLPLRRKQDDRELLIKLAVGVGSGGLQLPRGLVGGQELRLLLRRLTLRGATIDDFDRLPIRFRAIATDVETGQMVVLGRGDLADAIHASMAVPAAFAPVELDGRLLVDGGVARNLAVDVARSLGAEHVIAVDVGSSLELRGELRTALDVSSQVITILTRQNSEPQASALAAGDVLVRPELGRLSTTDFGRVLEAVRRGEEAALTQRAALEALRRSALWPAPPTPGASTAPGRRVAPLRVHFVRIENHSRLDERRLRRMLHLRAGEWLDVERLQHDLARIYGLGGVEEVSFRLVQEEGQSGVVVRVRERSGGTDAVRFGLHLSDDWRGNNTYHLLAHYTRTQLNSLGGEARVRLQVGQTDHASAELFQPLGRGPWFVAPSLEYRRQVIVAPAQWQAGEYRSGIARAGLGAGLQVENWAELRASLLAERLRADALPALGEAATAEGRLALQLRAEVDRLDDAEFPRRGTLLDVEWLDAGIGGTSQLRYQRLALNALAAASRGPHALLASLSAGSSLGTALPAYDQHRLGGLLRLSGTAPNSAAGDEMALARLVYLQRLHSGLLLARSGDLHLGGSLEAGAVWQQEENPHLRDLRPAASVILAVRTLLGPLYLAYGWAEGGENTGYLALGRTF